LAFAARHQVRAGEAGPQLLTEVPAVGRLHPAAEADACGHDDHIGRRGDARTRRGQQLVVVTGRHDPDGRCLHDARPASLEQGGELLTTPRGNRDGEAGEWEIVHVPSCRDVGTERTPCPARVAGAFPRRTRLSRTA